MEVFYNEGSRKSFDEMDFESQDAVRKAVDLVKGKRGFTHYVGNVYGCHLEVTFGHNIYSTIIEIRSEDNLCCAFFYEGSFYESISKVRVELI